MKQLQLRNLLLVGILLLAALPGYGLTITGTVFVDKNSDGVMQASEGGIANTAVSDGHQVVITNSMGKYQLDTEPGRFVFVSLPKGYKAVKSFYSTVESEEKIDFPVSRWLESAADSIRFVQITDLHIKDKGSAQTVIDDIADVNTMNPKPAFVVATGDLVDDAKNVSEYENMIDAVSKVSVPIFINIGNHDVLGGNENYQRFCGPRYYSFNAGNCHFILLDCTQFDDKQKAWVEKDIAAAPKSFTRIFLMHYIPTRENMRLFANWNAAAVLSGHWHGSRHTKTFGVLNLNTPPFRFGGIDRTPASFQVVDVKKGSVTSELRFTGQKKRAAIVTPVGKVSAPNGELQVLVNAYDTWAGVESVDCQINGKSYSLIKKSPWSWTGKISVNPSKPAAQYLTAVIYGSNGKRWTTSSKFQVDIKTNPVKTGADWTQWHNDILHRGVAAEAVQLPLRMAWAANTGGMIGISSPMMSGGIVTIGVADVGNLENCGIAAFDAVTGAPRWYCKTDSAVKGSPVITDGKVFAISIAGYLYALDLNNGKILWKASLYRHIERWEVASPAVADGVVYAGGPLYLAAYEANTGKLIWERSIQNSVDKKTGDKLWDRARSGPDDWVPTNYTVPTPVDDKLLVPTRGGLFALEKATGEPIWKTDGRCNVGTVINGVVYTIQNMIPTAIKLDSGEVIWTGKDKLGDCTSSPALFEDRMIVGSGNGRVCAFSTKDGSLLWNFQTGKAIADTMLYVRGKSDVNSSPVISGDTVYVGASDGYFYALSLATGKKLWSYYLGVPIASSPAISGNAIFVAGYDGNVYAFTGHN